MSDSTSTHEYVKNLEMKAALFNGLYVGMMVIPISSLIVDFFFGSTVTGNFFYCLTPNDSILILWGWSLLAIYLLTGFLWLYFECSSWLARKTLGGL